jgi:transposase-like protein
MRKPPDPHYRHRFRAELISHALWPYYVFSLSFRDVELILAERGVIVSYESIRPWCLKFGASFASSRRQRRPRPGDKWHLDEVFIRIRGELHYLWRAVDQHGIVPDILVQSRRDASPAKRSFRRLLKGLQYVSRVPITGKLGSYGAANESCCLMSSIRRAANSTIVRRIRIDQPAGKSGRCRGSNRCGRRSASCPPTLSSMATCVRGVTEPQPGTTGARVPWPSRSGRRRRAPWTVKLTMPFADLLARALPYASDDLVSRLPAHAREAQGR